MDTLDDVDARILLALDASPRAPVVELAARVGLPRRTVQHRVTRLEEQGRLRAHSDRVSPRDLGYQVAAMVMARVHQPEIDNTVAALARIPELLEVSATSGEWDLTCRVVARDNDDLYRINHEIRDCPGIVRTATLVLLRDLVIYRTSDLLTQLAHSREP